MTRALLAVAKRVVSACVQDAMWHDSGKSLDVHMAVYHDQHGLWHGTLTREAALRLVDNLATVKVDYADNEPLRLMQWTIGL